MEPKPPTTLPLLIQEVHFVIQEFAISEGWTVPIFSGGGVPLQLFDDRPIFSPLGSGWEIIFMTSVSDPPGVVVWTTYAICFDNSPLR
jgi:hypothetical protein